MLAGALASYPPAVKPKGYKAEMRKRFCEALLSRRVLIAEGRTEYDAYPAAARRLHELHPEDFRSLEALGIAIVDAETDSQIAPMGEYYKQLGKTVFAVFDKQAPAQLALIFGAISYTYEATEKGFENVILNGTTEVALRRFAAQVVANNDWPTHLIAIIPTPATIYVDLVTNMREYFRWAKGNGAAADFLSSCTREEMPAFIVETLKKIQLIIEPQDEIAKPELVEVAAGAVEVAPTTVI